jgi:hypothetical protein
MTHVIKVAIAMSLLAAGSAYAQTNAQQPGTSQAQIAAPTVAPVSGANSFTQGQARSRIEADGFGDVKSLRKDSKGVWHATAMKDGRVENVYLDYQGKVYSKQ